VSSLFKFNKIGVAIKNQQQMMSKSGQKPEYAPMDILEREFELSQILPGRTEFGRSSGSTWVAIAIHHDPPDRVDDSSGFNMF
jgi:hypothetical protein